MNYLGHPLPYDLLDFEQRDEVDALAADEARALATGLPVRPGTLR